MNKIIIDADPGVDDAFAIILAGMSKSIDLLGVTVVGGNCGIKNGIRNARLDTGISFYYAISFVDKDDD